MNQKELEDMVLKSGDFMTGINIDNDGLGIFVLGKATSGRLALAIVKLDYLKERLLEQLNKGTQHIEIDRSRKII